MLESETVYAVDYHQELLDELNSNYSSPNILFVKNNGDDFPEVPDKSIDFIFSFGTFVHLELNLIDKYLFNMKRLLTPTSNVVIQYSDIRKPMARELNNNFSANNPEIMRKLVLSHGYEIFEEDDKTLWHSSIIRFGLKKTCQINTQNFDLFDDANFLLLTYDSCRFDVLKAAKTPVLDSFCEIVSAQSPGNFTYAAHHAFFVGILPNATQNVPFYNRFNKQLLGLVEVGETNVVKDSIYRIRSSGNLINGFSDLGYQTVGAAAMNWFKQSSLISGFDKFVYSGTDANSQIDFILANIKMDRNFFGFINFGETHAPFIYEGKTTTCNVDVRARIINWPPRQGLGPVGQLNDGFSHQIEAAEFLDSCLPRLFSKMPANTIVILCADHGECFGEDGYWGHGFNHPCVTEVPLAIFRLDGKPLY